MGKLGSSSICWAKTDFSRTSTLVPVWALVLLPENTNKSRVRSLDTQASRAWGQRQPVVVKGIYVLKNKEQTKRSKTHYVGFQKMSNKFHAEDHLNNHVTIILQQWLKQNYLSTVSLKSNLTYIISYVITYLYYYNSYIYYWITILCFKSYWNCLL